MDLIAGAGELEWRRRCHEHWRGARAVREGLQWAHDPDAAHVVELGDGVRVYSDGRGSDGASSLSGLPMRKRLVDGRWRSEGSIDDGSGDATVLERQHSRSSNGLL